MATAGILFVRNEEDILPYSLPHAIEQFDFILAVDNLSTDSTKEILNYYSIDFSTNIHEKYQFSDVMTNLALLAGERGADWIVPFDADEFWYAPDNQTVSDWLSKQNGFACISHVYDYFVTDQDSELENNIIKKIGWRSKDFVPLKDIACRYDKSMKISNGSHMVKYDFSADFFEGLSVKHYPVRSFDQFESKTIRAKKLFESTPELPLDEGNHWRERVAALNEDRLYDFYKNNIEISSPSSNRYLIFDNNINRSPK